MMKKAIYGIITGSFLWFIITNILDVCLGTFSVDSILAKLEPLIIVLLLSSIALLFVRKKKI
jgi:hypothetical protein